jgi:hypothetical protein
MQKILTTLYNFNINFNVTLTYNANTIQWRGNDIVFYHLQFDEAVCYVYVL